MHHTPLWQVSLSRSKALKGRMPSPLRREMSLSSDLHTAGSVPSAAEAGMAEVAKSTYQDVGSDIKVHRVWWWTFVLLDNSGQ